jgi:HEAT repeat protein
MRKWFKNLLAGIALIMVAVMVWLVLRQPSEPKYKGTRLRVWLREHEIIMDAPGSIQIGPNAVEALNHVGTNAIPVLLKMLAEQDSDLKLKLIELAQRQHFININPAFARDRNIEAAEAFRVLGSSASNAVPELIRIYHPEGSHVSRTSILSALGSIGPMAHAAVPLLLRETADTNDVVRRFALQSLGDIHSEKDVTIPALEKALVDPDSSCRLTAVLGLAKFGTNARSATSSLVEMLAVPSEFLRFCAVDALGKIYEKAEWPARALDEPTPADPPSTLIQIIEGFQAMGTNAAPAVPALVKFLSDPDEGVRRSATNALKAIDPQAAAKAGVQ